MSVISLTKAFFRGMGSVLNIWPTTTYLPPEHSTEEALTEDLKKVGEDVGIVLNKALEKSKEK